jgi:hypothetical protein
VQKPDGRTAGVKYDNKPTIVVMGRLQKDGASTTSKLANRIEFDGRICSGMMISPWNEEETSVGFMKMSRCDLNWINVLQCHNCGFSK